MTLKRFFVSLFTLLTVCAHADDEADFSVQPPPAWTRSNPVGLGSFTFADGKARLSSPAPSAQLAQILGPARLGLIAPTVYSQVVVSADVTAWSGTRTFANVGLRLANVGLGTTTGYSFSLLPTSGFVGMYRIAGEIPTLISVGTTIPIQAGHSYRLVFAASGSTLKGRIFDLADLSTPLVEITVNDATYAQGLTGLGVTTDALVPVDATFDNFLAWDGTPPALSIASASGGLVISTNALRSLATNVESTDDLSQPWQQFFPIKTFNGAVVENFFFMVDPQRYYRLRMIAAP